jgi:sec-independent protein translocase protein TatC
LTVAEQDSPSTDSEQSFVSHLVELRDRLLKAAYWVIAAMILLAIFPGPSKLVDFMIMPIQPFLPPGTKLIATSVISPVMVPLKILGLCALLLALPAVLYQAWMFVAPGLYAHEKKLAMPIIISGYVLFLIGAGFVHFFVIGQMFKFIQNFAPASISATPDIASYAETLISLYLVFGISFQVPVVILLLVRFNMVTVKQLREYRGYFWVGAAVISAVVTPPDFVSQIALLVPMGILYELGIIFSGVYTRASKAPVAGAEADAAAAEASAGKDAK